MDIPLHAGAPPPDKLFGAAMDRRNKGQGLRQSTRSLKRHNSRAKGLHHSGRNSTRALSVDDVSDDDSDFDNSSSDGTYSFSDNSDNSYDDDDDNNISPLASTDNIGSSAIVVPGGEAKDGDGSGASAFTAPSTETNPEASVVNPLFVGTEEDATPGILEEGGAGKKRAPSKNRASSPVDHWEQLRGAALRPDKLRTPSGKKAGGGSTGRELRLGQIKAKRGTLTAAMFQVRENAENESEREQERDA